VFLCWGQNGYVEVAADIAFNPILLRELGIDSPRRIMA
jgi:hypothetical protein